ncbi:hypothetical protein OV079_49215 [Nannocystis pusilla]|uniref:Uncharacterized protein n=1 Tax=Nannocystis pusilla TaxID=889268 RepID=A0A9X3F151_9BACT|nr:hypothetical protein [Nannocystis pusilla]MCY1013380.1 hypothetical protein [Nannocystis pusilla]
MATAVLLERGYFLAAPYPSAAREIAAGFDAAVALDAAEADAVAPDDTPSTARRIPALGDALIAASSARFADAARMLAAFAIAEPHAREAGWALRRSYQFWRALGRDDEARGVLAAYESTQARREPRAAALFFWQRGAELADDSQRAEHARRYLAEHAAHGPRDLRIIAESELAAVLWRRSCASARYGLCVDVAVVRRDKIRCGPAKVELIVPRARNRELLGAALDHAAAALRAGERLDLGEVAPWRRGALRSALGQAATMVADEAIERLIALEFPADLGFFVEEWKHVSGVARWEAEYREQVRRRERSERLFRRYWRQYGARLELAQEHTLAVAGHSSGPAIMAVSLHFAVALAKVQDDRRYKVDVPAKLAGDSPFVYCDGDLEQPLFEEVLALLSGCARMAGASGHFTPEIGACFDGLGIYDPDLDDPPLAEFHGPLG